jgi:putative Mg2+ transporter-C (MgtC) family protein
MLSSILSGGTSSVAIAANIVTGIGFLGAGAILRDGNKISGLTTASTIWLSAAVGMAIGSGEYILAVAVTLTGLIILWIFPYIEVKIDNIQHTRTYEVICHPGIQPKALLESRLTEYGLKVKSSKRTKSEGRIAYTWQLIGNPEAHEEWIDTMLQDKDVLEFSY